jgi:hypothetical protein
MAKALTPRQRKIARITLAVIPFITATVAFGFYAITGDASSLSLLPLATVFAFTSWSTLKRSKGTSATPLEAPAK